MDHLLRIPRGFGPGGITHPHALHEEHCKETPSEFPGNSEAAYHALNVASNVHFPHFSVFLSRTCCYIRFSHHRLASHALMLRSRWIRIHSSSDPLRHLTSSHWGSMPPEDWWQVSRIGTGAVSLAASSRSAPVHHPPGQSL